MAVNNIRRFDTMNKRRFLFSLLMMLLVVTISVVAVSCGKKTPPDPEKTEWPEAGVYYFDAGNDEYTLTLNVGDTFALIVKGESASGSYTLEGEKLTLDFNAESKENVSATLADNVITMTYEGASMRMLKKLNYTVSFETNGGGSVASATVVNGKTVAKPADPVRDGFVFVGWYADSAFKTPFAFDAQPVTSDTKLYAQWSAELVGGQEYTVNFDLNYENAVNPDAMTTRGGKLFDLPTAQRDGFKFQGWWISMDKDGSKLSYQYTDGMVLDANTTLYALWQADATGGKLPAPVLNVSAGSVSWGAVTNARSYDVKVIGPDGQVLIDETTGSTTVNVPFATYAAGQYEIRVVANAQTGAENNSETVRYYTNKALRTVSVFNVVGSTLIFNTVENAEKYLITVECGNPEHNHTSFDNGTSRTFSFANCDMTAEGIRFTVTAVAEGYASSTSEVFVYKRDLSKVEGLRFDAANQLVSWNEVSDAAYYMVSVTCGNADHDHGFVNNGTKTFVSLKECAALDGGIVVKVYPVAKGYNSPEASEYTYEKTGLATPSGLVINGTLLSWNAVEGADEYEVQVGNQVYKTTETVLDLSVALNWVEGSEYALSVRATGDDSSAWSDTVVAKYYEMGALVSYAQGVLSWAPVIGAESYEVQVNDGAILTVSGENKTVVTLNKAGVNLLKVRFVDGTNRSEWVITEVFAHTVTFDTRGGSEIVVQYKAVGDKLELPNPTKTGYTFSDWYNVPGGPVSNGLAYNDEFFGESGSIVLYAYYNPNKYDVNYNYGVGGTGDKESDKVAFEQNYQLYVPAPDSVTGAFGGWFSAPYGMGTQYTDAKGNSLAPWDATEGAELYAFWIDEALAFTLTQVNGKVGYVVTAGARIALVSEVTVPATYQGRPVLMVAGNAFKDCTNLKVINLPETLEQISLIDPFSGCTNLSDVNVYDVEGSDSYRYWSEDGVLFDNGNATSANAKLLYMPLAKTGTYRVPDGIAEIPASAFSGSQLSKVVIPASVTAIGNDAFAGCTSLTSVVFEAAKSGEAEKSLTIGKRAFSGCTMLERIILPARLTDIVLTKYVVSGSKVATTDVDNAFAGCTALKSITVAANSKTYKSVDGVLYSLDGRTLYYCPASKTGEFTVPTGVQTIAPGAFIGCSELTELTIPNTVTYVGECAFYGLDITKVTFLGNGFNDMTVGRYAFRDCAELAEVVTTGSRIAAINDGAFYGCTSITSFSLPSSTVSVGVDAFRDCTALESMTLADSSKELQFGENAFYNCSSLAYIYIPANVSKIHGIFSGCTSLVEVEVSTDSEYFTTIEGVLFNKDVTEIIFFPQGKTAEIDEYVVPATVTVINNGVFRGVSGLDRIVLPNALTVIGDDAFRDTDISELVFEGDVFGDALTIGVSAFESSKFENVVLPAHTKSLGDYAFAHSSIATITLNDGLESLGEYAFNDVYYLETIDIPGSVKVIGAYCFYNNRYLDVVTLHEGLEIIGDYAFQNVGYYGYDYSIWEYVYYFTEITIPASVKVIGNYAFADSYLESITFAPESQLTTIGAYAFDSTGITSIHIPKNVTSIGAYAFYYSDIETVTFEEGGTAPLVIGTPYSYSYEDYWSGAMVTEVVVGHTFYYASKLTSVTFPSRLVELKEYSFYYAGKSSGMTVDFGANSQLTTIGRYCFYYSNLNGINIPKSVRNLDPVVNDEFGLTYDRMGIGEYAFYGLYNTLASLTFELGGTDPLTIGANAFDNADMLTSLVLPARLAPYTSHTGDVIPGLANGSSVFNDAAGITGVEVEDGGKYYVDLDGVVYSADLTELVYCPIGKEGVVNVPASVTKIHDRAFYSCANLTEINLAVGTSAMTIGNEAFARCSGLTSLVLPTNVESLGNRAFYYCSNLESITLSEKLQNFDGGMIERCTSLKEILVEDGNAFFFSDNGVLYNAEKTTLVVYPVNREDTAYTVLSTVTVIEEKAFENNTKLVEVILPNGLVEIKYSAFSYATALTTVVIPNTVELIDENAFGGCSSLTNLSFEKGGDTPLVIGKYGFQNSGVRSVELPARVAVLDHYVFYYSELESIKFAPNSQLTNLGDQVFQSTNLVSVVLPDGIISIGDSTFIGCAKLESVVFGEGLISIGDTTFEKGYNQPTSLKSVYFPASLKTMGINTFKECTSLEEVIFAPNSQLEKLPTGTFYLSSIKEFTVPASVTEIASDDDTSAPIYGVFESASSLVSVTFENGTKCQLIGSRAFFGCSSLENIDIPASVSTLGNETFYGCTSLEKITIPATTTQLGTSLFSGASSLKEVVLKTKATQLPGYMFNGCSSLTSVVIPASVTSIGNNCFAGTAISAFEVEEGSQSFAVVDGILYSADLTSLMSYPPKSEAKVITIPKEVTSISDGTFSNNTTIRRVIFEEGGTAPLTIGEQAFYRCYNLAEVVLPERLTSIGYRAFYYCYDLTEITIPSTVTEIGNDAFDSCYKLVEVFNKSKLDITLGDRYSFGDIASNAHNVYTPEEGESILHVDENGYVTATIAISDYYYGDTNYKYLVGYRGTDTDLVLPEDFDAFYDYLFYYRSGITSIVIPDGAGSEYMGDYAFFTTDYPLLLMGYNEKPAAWSSGWYYYCSVIWGFDGLEHTYNFVSNGGTEYDPVTATYAITLPTPTIDSDLIFGGWYDNPEFAGVPCSGSYYSATATTLYARWMTVEELYAGTSFEYAIELELGESVFVNIDEAYKVVYFTFTVTESGRYLFSSTADTQLDTMGTLYDSDGKYLDDEDYSLAGDWYLFDLVCDLEAGQTYYFTAKCYSSYTGQFNVTLTQYE